MIGFILAAGFGTRLKPLTDHVPKALVPVCGVPLITRAYDFLFANGIRNIGCNSHYKHDVVRSYVVQNHASMTMFHEETAIRGTGGALHFAKEFLTDNDSFCIANVDIISTVDLKKIIQEFQESGSVAALVAAPSLNGSIFYHRETKDYIGTRSQKRDKNEIAPSAQSADFIGLALYRREFLAVLKPDDFSIVPVWTRAQNLGMKISVIETGPVYWIDTGTAQTLAQVHFDFLDEKIAFPIPSAIHVETKQKKAYPIEFSAAQQNQLGRYCWVESTRIPPGALLQFSVVFSDAEITQTTMTNNAIVTRYGVINFGK